MDWMTLRFAPRSKSDSNRRHGMASPRTRTPFCISCFNWPKATASLKEIMSSLKLPPLSWVVVLFLSLFAVGQSADPNQPASTPQNQAAEQLSVPAPSSPVTFDQVMDKVVEREHFFNAQMRHLHPLVETYIQNLKNTKDATTVPTKDEYFLGRLDMSDGADDRSFMGQPGFGRQVMNKLTSLYSLRFLPLGFAQMVVLDD